MPKELFHDVETGETVERELTADEIAALPEPTVPLDPA
jgi:hypothetical protein